MRGWWLVLLLLIAFPVAAFAQGQQCRTSPKGASTPYCASEAFVTQSAGVSGPATSTANAIPRFADTTGTSLLNSSVLIDGSNNISGAASFTTTGQISGGTVAGAMVATKAQQQAGSSAALIVSPLHQQDHDSAAKAWVMFTGSATNGPQTINASYNVTSVTRNSIGQYSVALTTSFASASYACIGMNNGTATDAFVEINAQAAGSFLSVYVKPSVALYDPTNGAYLVCFGRQ